jgi:hypothetical protein
LRVTFDTNTLDPITQPDLAGSMRAECTTIHAALQSKRLEGFFCETILTVEGQPQRDDTVARVQRALDLGMRILSAPRAGSTRILSGDLYASDVDESTRLQRYSSIASAIESRGLGFARMSKIARVLAPGGSDSESANSNRVIASGEARRVARAVAEWADGDSVAAHHSYANDLFCTQDRAKRAGRDSILHPAHRGWLRRVYGVEFVDIAELAARLGRFD